MRSNMQQANTNLSDYIAYLHMTTLHGLGSVGYITQPC